MSLGLNILLGITTLFSLFVSVFVVCEIVMTSKIKKAKKESLPLKLRRAISYSQFHSALKTAQIVLDEIRFVPDIVLGIHYQGLAYAAQLAKIMYKPVKHAEIYYIQDGSHKHIFDSLSYDFDPNIVLKNKRVLILDNTMETGATLMAVRKEVAKFTSQIITLVVYDKNAGDKSLIKPDIVLFSSDTPKQFLK